MKQTAIDLNSKYKWNIVPMYSLTRDKEGRKHPKMIDWQEYKARPYPLKEWRDEYKNLMIMTGKISNLTIIDIDSQEALDTLLSTTGLELDTVAEYIIKTQKGYQLFYKYLPNAKTRIGLLEKIDFLSGGVTFAHPTNPGYSLLKDNIPKEIPQVLQDYLVTDSIEPQLTEFEQKIKENSNLAYRNPLYYTIQEFLDSDRLAKRIKNKLEKVFCNKEYKSLTAYSQPGQIHTSMLSAGAIVATDPTIDEDMYINFMEHWAKKVAKMDLTDLHEQKCLQMRIDGNMKIFSYNPDWKIKNQELNNIKALSQDLEIVTWRCADSEKYVYYVPETKIFHKWSKPFFKEELAHQHNKKYPDEPITEADIDTRSLPVKYETFNPSIDDEFYTDPDTGREMFNYFQRTPLMKYFQIVTPKKKMPEFINNLLQHLYPIKEERDLFLHTLAYHLTYLNVSPTSYILTGKSGTGKNMLMQGILKEIYQDMHITISADTLTNKFRNQLKNKLLVFIDEVSEKSHKPTERGSIHNVIKQIVANKEITIESKGKDELTYPNHALYTMASNKDEPFKLEEGFDRRINITKTNDQNLRSLSWFPTHLSSPEIDTLVISETPDFIAYLASIELDHIKYSTIIENKQRQSLITSSVSIIDQYIDNILERDIDKLYDLDYDFAEWFEKVVIVDDVSAVTLKLLKEKLGNVGAKVIKGLRAAGLVDKRVNRQRSLVINPKGKGKLASDIPIEVEGI